MVQGVQVEDGFILNSNPATGELISKVKCSSSSEVDAMIADSKQAQVEWMQRSAHDRIDLLKQGLKNVEGDSEAFINKIVQEMGKPIQEATEEMEGAVDKDEFLSILENSLQPQQFGKSVVVRHPLGVVAVLSPWNYPVDEILLLALPALASGNTVIVKPSEVVPESGALLVKHLQSVLPANVLQIAQGDGAVGARLVESDGVNMVAMTGSSATGRKILANAAPKLKRLVLEMGGKDPMVVFDDADLEKAAKDAVAYSLSNTGQVCCSTERIYVSENSYAKFQDLILECAKSYKVGNGMDADVQVGPMVSSMQMEHVKEQVKDAVSKGAKMVYQSDIPTSTAGNFFPVTVLADVSHEMSVFSTETFGPVVAMAKFDGSEETAIRLANSTEYGLGSSIYTKDVEKARRVAHRIDAGQVGINCYPLDNMDINCPWVGHKHSGFGFHSGVDGFHQFSIPKSLIYDFTP